MNQTLKIVIPTAGWGTRMRPQTWSKPKPLVSVAGKTAIDHLLDSFKTVPVGTDVEYIIIVGPGFGEQQIPPYMQEHHPELKVHYVLQPEMKGQSNALWLAREYMVGPTIVIYSDTLIETDFSILEQEQADGIAWVKDVPDPRRFGVAKLDPQGWITELEEKPQGIENTLVVVGCYYFREGQQLISAIREQIRRKLQFRGEYFLVHAINILLKHDSRLRTQLVDVWLDTGTIDATLDTNRYMLEHRKENKGKSKKRDNVKIVEPVFIHKTAKISDAVIGPFASIGAGCVISDARIEDSILDEGVTVEAAALIRSYIGRRAQVCGRSSNGPPMMLNVGDDSSIMLK
jgi:glucose-1-phosphate thymidylyltransferase